MCYYILLCARLAQVYQKWPRIFCPKSHSKRQGGVPIFDPAQDTQYTVQKWTVETNTTQIFLAVLAHDIFTSIYLSEINASRLVCKSESAATRHAIAHTCNHAGGRSTILTLAATYCSPGNLHTVNAVATYYAHTNRYSYRTQKRTQRNE